MRRVHSSCASAAILCALAIAALGAPQSAGAQQQSYSVEPVAVTGEPAPGTGGLNFEWLGTYSANLNEAGTIVFTAATDPLNSGVWDFGIWTGSAGGLAPAIRSGDQVPGGTAQFFSDFHAPQINAFGEVSFRGIYDGGYASGIWVGTPGNFRPLAMQGDPAPGTVGELFRSPLPGIFDVQGVSSFWADTTTYGQGIWRGTPDLIAPIAIAGEPAPGTGTLNFHDLDTPSAGDTETVIFYGRVGTPASGFAEGIWMAGPAGVSLVSLAGNEAPGTGGRQFRQFQLKVPTGPGGPTNLDIARLNDAGDLVFNAYIDSVDPANPTNWFGDEGIWIKDASGLRLIALTGDTAPGTVGLRFRHFDSFDFNAFGQLAFSAELLDADPLYDRGIWFGTADNFGLVVREGDSAPGTLGETFGELGVGPIMNDTGAFVFLALLRESGTYGIWGRTPAGDLVLIARMGEALKVGTGDYRTIAFIETFSNFNSATRFNQAGQLIFWTYFSDGSEGIFLASPLDTTVNSPPVADAGPDLTVADSSTAVLDGSGSFDPENTILTFAWSIDGVAVATGPKATVGPFPAGTRTVTLTVTDRSGDSATDSMLLTVQPNLPPIADAGLGATIQTLETVVLDGTGSSDPEGGPLTYVWTLNGAQIGTGPTPVAGPFAAGVHTVTLTVADSLGVTASDTVVITVLNRSPLASAGPDQSVNHAQTIALDGTESSDPEGGPLSYAWSLGGAPVATGPNPVVGPFAVGSYTVTLTVTDDRGASATDTSLLTVINESPTASAGTDRTIRTLETVALDGSGSVDPEGAPLSYLWSLGGTQIGTGRTPIVAPLDAGVHTIILTVTDDYGATASDAVTVTVLNRAPVASAGPDRTANHAQTVTLDGTASNDPEGGALSYAWSLGGTPIAVGPNPTVGPFAVGTHSVTLTVTDEHGATATDTTVITVINEAPVADAGPDQSVGVKGKATTVTLDGTASGDPEGGALSYRWTKDGLPFGTGAMLQVEVGAGVHTFVLTVTDDHGASASDSVVVTATRGNKTASL